MEALQLPWQWLSIASVASAVLLPGGLASWKEYAIGRTRPLALIGLGLMVSALAILGPYELYVARYLTQAEIAQLLTKLPGLPSVGPLYPKWATVNSPGPSEQVTVADREVTVDSWGTEHRTLRVGPGQAEDARIRTFYYPLWTASIEGRTFPTHADPDGAMLISFPLKRSR